MQDISQPPCPVIRLTNRIGDCVQIRVQEIVLGDKCRKQVLLVIAMCPITVYGVAQNTDATLLQLPSHFETVILPIFPIDSDEQIFKGIIA
jgi:hypothetical protein